MEKARNEANRILNELGINSIPVDPYLIADKLNCKIMKISPDELPNNFPCDKNSFAGALIKNSGDTNYILVNKTDSLRRQNFTIAHELGHLVMHVGENDENHIDCRDSIFSNKNNELQANEFAGSLLMPVSWLESIVNEVTDDNQELASIFDVSLQALETRRNKLNI
ncbi:ImmA/IrrE family metallo-endopeptidase [Aliarcobacter butzleri]